MGNPHVLKKVLESGLFSAHELVKQCHPRIHAVACVESAMCRAPDAERPITDCSSLKHPASLPTAELLFRFLLSSDIVLAGPSC